MRGKNVQTNQAQHQVRHRIRSIRRSPSFDRRQFCEDPVLEPVDYRLCEFVAHVWIDLVLAADAQLAQFLVRSAAPLGQHERVVNSVCLIQRRKFSVVMFRDCLCPQ